MHLIDEITFLYKSILLNYSVGIVKEKISTPRNPAWIITSRNFLVQ